MKTFIRRKSLANQSAQLVEHNPIKTSLSDAGNCCNKIAAIEVWKLNELHTNLCRIENGWWCSSSIPYDDEKRPGNGLARKLWAENTVPGHFSAKPKKTTLMAMSDSSSFRQKLFSRNNKHHHHASLKVSSPGGHHEHSHHNSSGLRWTSLAYILADPDQIGDSRLPQLIEAGITHVCGVPFSTPSHDKGVVIFFSTHVEDENVPQDLFYLFVATAYHIGAVVALQAAREEILPGVSNTNHGMKVSPKELVVGKQVGSDHPTDALSEDEEIGDKPLSTKEDRKDPEKSSCISFQIFAPTLRFFQIKIRMLTQKTKGNNMSPPPCFSLSESIWTLSGVGITTLLVMLFSHFTKKYIKEDSTLILGPMGALMTLQYGLTSAPAGQPRNIIYGNLLAGSIAMLFTYIPVEIIPSIPRVSLATCVAISAMTKFGLTHPPAGGLAISLATGKYSWIDFCISMISGCIAIVTATIINNLDEKRQYPQYWKIIPQCQIKMTEKEEINP